MAWAGEEQVRGFSVGGREQVRKDSLEDARAQFRYH